MPKVAVLASGTGSILEAIIAYPLPVEIVIADRPCRAIEIARKARISTCILDRVFDGTFDETARAALSLGIAHLLCKYEVAAMAGFQTILSPKFFQIYRGVLLNTHPSLLPAFKGRGAVNQALRACAMKTGCTVHIATAQPDEGPVLAQQEVLILGTDTAQTLHERIKKAERELYPKTIAAILDGTLKLPVTT